MVITTSAALTNSSVSGLGNSLDRLTPHSSMAAATAGLIRSAGAEPGRANMNLALAWWSRRAAAIWLRPALWTKTNRTSGRSRWIAPWAWARPGKRSRAKRWTNGGGIDLDLFDKTTFAALVDEVRVLLKTDA
jgi:hypothetical protein